MHVLRQELFSCRKKLTVDEAALLVPCAGACLTHLPRSELHSDRFAGTFTPFRFKPAPFRNGHLYTWEALNKSPTADDESFPPILRFEKLEIHKVFRRFPNLALTKNLSPSTAADLIRASLNSVVECCKPIAYSHILTTIIFHVKIWCTGHRPPFGAAR